jgi:hypothetical protein
MVTALFLVATVCVAESAQERKLLDGIRQVESRGRDVVGDGGKAIGPYQIWKQYHSDSRVSGSYERCHERAYSEDVVRAYWQRHAAAESARLRGGKATSADMAKLARIHNGGPRGYVKPQTLPYAAKVMRATKR